ncbi:MAG: phosphatase PAP2 family protein [Prevotella sp.]|uniref:phosphatase PAP2 family protein n=1 Tax=Leyella stercorea TaxID=363265 RepID=UPI001F374FE7|nr:MULTISPECIES: phosphatase PAP2 family protein [Prevotellaceae]MCF2645164.1 phosphatase PAP2 family protein [Leyella stercorea]MDD6199254.1 phosphatase PAP2 family protein [Prevotella sp.]MDY3968035.1 phosphatase PAP2 family protein [Prevotella sp.]MDY4644327.1 phosphatase PAP2 family protein [Prevotella sp.]
MLLDIQTFLANDRLVLSWFNGSNSVFLDGWMSALTSGFTWLALYASLFYLVVKNNETMGQIMLVVGCALACVGLADIMADVIVKPLVERWRPSNDPIFKYDVSVVDGYRGTSYGFFSAHAANTFSLALFFCMLVRSRVLSVALVLWSFVNCYTRMYLGLHYPSDIVCGLLWGSVCAIGVYYFYLRVSRRMFGEDNYVSTQYTSTGYRLCDVDIVVFVLVSTVLITLFKALFIY